jgi:hypothetical protein
MLYLIERVGSRKEVSVYYYFLQISANLYDIAHKAILSKATLVKSTAGSIIA